MQTEIGHVRRLFSSDYRSSGQRIWQDTGGDGWNKTMLAQMRCDIVAAERLVIPDSHLFDGAFLAYIDPTALADGLGRRNDPKVRGLSLCLRHGSIRDSLTGWLVRPKSDTLNAQAFSVAGAARQGGPGNREDNPIGVVRASRVLWFQPGTSTRAVTTRLHRKVGADRTGPRRGDDCCRRSRTRVGKMAGGWRNAVPLRELGSEICTTCGPP
jgi:hypothetical protein